MTINIDGKEFTFVKPTITFMKKYSVAKLEAFFAGLDFMKIAEEQPAYEEFVTKWKAFCDVAFEKDLKWRLGLRPKELDPETMPLPEIARVAKSFFAYVGDGMR